MTPAAYRVHRQAAATLVWQPVDSAGEPVAATGVPTVTIVRSSGTALVPAAGPSIVSGSVNLTLSATELADVDRLTVTWLLDGVLRGVSDVDVVGGVYLTVAEIRALEPATATFPVADLQRCRREVESRFERSVRSVAFVPRLSVYRSVGTGRHLSVPGYFTTEIRWARTWSTGTWSTVDLTSLRIDTGGAVQFSADWTGSVVEVGYVHGMSTPPEDVKRAAAKAVVYQATVNRSGIDARATSYQPAEGGNVVLATPGLGPWEFGIPDIDGVLRSWRDRYPQALIG